ncbi:LysR family transcriptional regulator [Variovorax ginsengisoli]|uniref:DNA-binding transcriptional LysR family regulator n=1 Tax=Variovorax ginsengisoli TaxID=363844 RepID=A0ABT9SCD6_9BURK|nr:LysR family transcriptional regulator [Variovorax ginsengisoli]MDP9901995.1 DNA-binding transcriptional LysR family regulator [Variovorax ginsengisoli]
MFDWEDLRHFIAVGRAGSLSGAARELKVDHATVSRRLTSLERALQVRLVERLPRACRLTDVGAHVFTLALALQDDAFAIERVARASQSPLAGKVSLSVPPVLVASFLAPHLTEFRQRFPAIQLSVSGQAQQVSLSRREADIAVRLVRPKEPGSVVRKLGTMAFALYASRHYQALSHPERWEFIAYDARFEDMPQQKWLRSLAGKRPIACELSDINSHHAAVRAGAGVGGLPCFLGDADETLLRVSDSDSSFARDIWLVVHRDMKSAGPVRAAMDFLIEVMKRNAAFNDASMRG